MSKYTIELRYLNQPIYGQVFDFDYKYYMKDLVSDEIYKEKKKEFEEKFLEFYACEEIGFDTPEMFKHYLKSYLDLNFKLWNERYKTELQVEKDNIDFLLNKDLKEERTTESSGESNSTVTNSGESSSNSSGSNKEQINDTPSTRLDNKNYATQITTSDNTNNSNTTSNDKTESNGKSNAVSKDTFISRGNIGITSSAELLEKWRSVIIDIDKEIILGASDLFFQLL